MNDKLSAKDIAPYLPYELKCKVTDRRKTVIATLGGLYSDGNCVFHDIVESEKGFSKIKPILRPMTDLVKPLPDGTIPIVALFMIVSNNSIVESEIIIQSLIKNTVFIAHYRKSGVLGFDTSTQSFFAVHKNKSCSPANQVDLFNYLYAHHFDINNLIGRGLAIDANTIKI